VTYYVYARLTRRQAEQALRAITWYRDNLERHANSQIPVWAMAGLFHAYRALNNAKEGGKLTQDEGGDA